MPATELDRLISAIRRSFNLLKRAADRLHADDGVSASMRAVLERVVAGPETVPAIAREKHVTRQFIQARVDELAAVGLVAAGRNPRHARSALIAPTAKGRALFARLKRREAPLAARLATVASAREVAAAADVIERLNQHLSSDGGPDDDE